MQASRCAVSATGEGQLMRRARRGSQMSTLDPTLANVALARWLAARGLQSAGHFLRRRGLDTCRCLPENNGPHDRSAPAIKQRAALPEADQARAAEAQDDLEREASAPEILRRTRENPTDLAEVTLPDPPPTPRVRPHTRAAESQNAPKPQSLGAVCRESRPPDPARTRCVPRAASS